MFLKSLLRGLIPMLILALAATGFYTLMATKPRPLASPDTEQVWVVDLEKIEPRSLAPSLTLYGRLESPRLAGMSAAVAGEVLEVPVREGRDVAPGELLVRLDDRELRSVLLQRQADVAEIEALIASERRRHANDREAMAQENSLLELAVSAVQRSEDLVKRNLGSQSQLDEARQAVLRQQLAVTSRSLAIEDHPARMAQLEARADRARAQLALAELDLERTRIAAPFAGRLARVGVAPGARVRAGDRIADLYELGSLEVRAQVPGGLLAALREMLAREGELHAVGRVDGEQLDLVLDRFAGEVRTGGGVDALFGVRTASAGAALGRFMEVLVQLPALDDTIDLPREAIYGADRVYKVVDGRMALVRVERLGLVRRPGELDDRVLVRSPGLSAGDEVIVTQVANAMDGLRVRSAAQEE